MSSRAFAFGKNWSRFLDTISEDAIEQSSAGLTKALGDIRRKSFLDVGCGSGIHSLAALRLGASRVHSFDFDADSVACCQRLRLVQAPPFADWTIERGSALDADYLRSLGKFDVVYAWGVLHHTGDMWKALDLVTVPAADRLFLSIYNDQGIYSRAWRAVKASHAHSPAPLKRAIESGVFGFTWGKHFLRHPLTAVRNYRNYGESRGMSPWHDAVDWAGGYPFEVARPDQVVSFYESRGLRARCIFDCGRGHGCNEFLVSRY